MTSRRSQIRVLSAPPFYFAHLAQLVEHLRHMEEVGGSSLSVSTKNFENDNRRGLSGDFLVCGKGKFFVRAEYSPKNFFDEDDFS